MNSKFLGHYPKLKWKVYHIYRFFHDLSYSIRKNKNNLCPSGRTFVGDGNFVEIGNEFFQYFIDLCNVKRSAKILDLGSGMGRMAIPFTKYLDQNGIYYGFDVFKSGIQWSQKYITSQFSNFNFTHFVQNFLNRRYLIRKNFFKSQHLGQKLKMNFSKIFFANISKFFSTKFFEKFFVIFRHFSYFA